METRGWRPDSHPEVGCLLAIRTEAISRLQSVLRHSSRARFWSSSSTSAKSWPAALFPGRRDATRPPPPPAWSLAYHVKAVIAEAARTGSDRVLPVWHRVTHTITVPATQPGIRPGGPGQGLAVVPAGDRPAAGRHGGDGYATEGCCAATARDRHPRPLTAAGRHVTTKPRSRRTRRDSIAQARKPPPRRGRQAG